MLLGSIATVVLTDGLGNILIILAIGSNFPVYQEHRFRMLAGYGAILSLLLQP